MVKSLVENYFLYYQIAYQNAQNGISDCSVVTPVNHEHAVEGIRNTPLVVVARFESLKSELSFCYMVDLLERYNSTLIF